MRVFFEPSFDAWRVEARRLLADDVAPEDVAWVPSTGRHQGGLFDDAAPAARRTAVPRQAKASVPKSFVARARNAACHRDSDRWALLYRLLWRLTHGERRLLQIDVDPDVERLHRMEQAVRRDAHKMKAFVRFRRVVRGPSARAPSAGASSTKTQSADAPSIESEDAEPWYVAWHRPDHHIVDKVAPFFVERFNDQRWTILTPERSASWDRERLVFGDGVPRHEAPDADALERLWRTYYRSIFNPARLKVKAMKAEMPVKHWATLPEAELIPELVRSARARTATMLTAPEHPPAADFIPCANGPAAPVDATDRAARLDALAAALPACSACRLCTAGRPVFGEGPPDARLVLVGEQPGDAEERTGRPFVGPAGQVLDAALAAAGLDRSRIYLSNVVKHFGHETRPDPRAERGIRRIHRTPGQTEVSACLPWLEAELEQLRAPLLVCLGATAARALVGPTVRLQRDRGRPVPTPHAPWTLITVHPSAVLRAREPALRARLEQTLRADLVLAATRLRALDAA
ncbi:MAG: UdgX family uracil-DNA binding protein [Acidobacteriota bacterium]